MLQKGFQYSAVHRLLWQAACVLMALSAVICLVFLSPNMPVTGLDPSWTMGMSRGVDLGLKIGEDLVFTFGPLANIYTGAYSQLYDSQYLAVSLYLAAAFFMGVYGVFARHKSFAPVMIFAIVAVALSSRDSFFMLIPVLTSFALISDLSESSSVSRRTACLILLSSPALGALLLIKLSFSAICVLCVGVNFVLLVYGRKFFYAVVYILLPVISFVGLWLAFGQQLSSLGSYVYYARPVISGYGEAMASPGAPWLVVLFVIGCSVLGVGLVLIKPRHQYFSWLVAVVVAGYLFITFKAGFVRDDGHAALSGMALVFVAIICLRFLRGRQGLLVVLFAVVVGVVVIVKNLPMTPVGVVTAIYNNSSRAFNGVKARLFSPGQYKAEFDFRIKQIAGASDVPQLKGTTDIYSYGQASLIASGVSWSPRPVFQSYAAYTPELLSLNADRLKGPQGAENILFALQPIDGRMPSTEDGASWPIFYSQYQLKELSGEYAVLHRGSESAASPSRLETRTVKLGQDFSVPKFDGQVYMTAIVKPTLFGKVRSTLYKPSPLMLKLTLTNGQTRIFRIISGMTQTDFLLSPLVESTADFAFLYAGTGTLKGKEVVSAQIYTVKRKDQSWAKSVEVTFSGLKPPTDDSLAESLSVKPALVGNVPDGVCVGVIDSLNGSAPTQTTLETKNFLSVIGWNSTATTDFPQGAKNVVLLTGVDKKYVVRAKVVKRPDLVAYFKSVTMGDAGYSSIVDISGLSGRFQVGLGIEVEGAIHRCPGIAFNVDI